MQAQYFHYEILETYSLEELKDYKDHRRLKVFFEKGCTCVECGITATQLALGKDNGGNLHIDVYTDDFYPLTVDHIVPKSKGEKIIWRIYNQCVVYVIGKKVMEYFLQVKI